MRLAAASIQRIRELLRTDLSDAAIAQQVHCHPTTVGNYRRAMHVPRADHRALLLAELAPATRDHRPHGRMPVSRDRAAHNLAQLAAAIRTPAA